MTEKKPQRTSREEWTRVSPASAALCIPALMASGPLVGYYLGKWVGGFFEHDQAGAFAGLILGFIAGIRESIRLVLRLKAQWEGEPPKEPENPDKGERH